MKGKSRVSAWFYGIVFFIIVLSGFGQMPIFSRYYIADVPGLGWLGEFYVTHVLHYVAAVALMVLAFYMSADFFITKKGLRDLTGSGLTKAVILAGLIITGGLMVYKNFSGIYFSHISIIVLDLLHLALCMALLVISLYTLIRRQKWVR